jgi:hypothetical protein
MKKIKTLCFLFLLIACQEENATPTKPIDDDFDTATATLIRDGMFMGVGHSVSGTAAIYEKDGMHYVVLEPFSSQNGPDLKIYLSKDQSIDSYINLGAMKSTTGKQSYVIPDNTNIADYDHVLVWCQQFSVLFGKAEMM